MKKQANSRQCFVCGVENLRGLHLSFYEVKPGEICADITVPETYQGYPGVVHGGIVAAMLDEVSGRVFMGDPPRFMFTAKLSVRYRKPVPTGQPLRLVGYAGKDHGKVATARGELFDSNGTLLADAETVLADIPEAMQSFKLGPEDWMVYPD
jgi:uncharacterized protein (TIGR00369 family)